MFEPPTFVSIEYEVMKFAHSLSSFDYRDIKSFNFLLLPGKEPNSFITVFPAEVATIYLCSYFWPFNRTHFEFSEEYLNREHCIRTFTVYRRIIILVSFEGIFFADSLLGFYLLFNVARNPEISLTTGTGLTIIFLLSDRGERFGSLPFRSSSPINLDIRRHGG